MTRDVRLVALIEHSGVLLAIFESATRLRQSSSKFARRQAFMVGSSAYHVKEAGGRRSELPSGTAFDDLQAAITRTSNAAISRGTLKGLVRVDPTKDREMSANWSEPSLTVSASLTLYLYPVDLRQFKPLFRELKDEVHHRVHQVIVSPRPRTRNSCPRDVRIWYATSSTKNRSAV